MPTITPSSTLATLADFDERLAEVGLTVGDVADGPGRGPRLEVDRGSAGAQLVLVITTYARNGEGKRHIDTETRDAAVEVRRFFITTDWRLVAATNQEDTSNG